MYDTYVKERMADAVYNYIEGKASFEDNLIILCIKVVQEVERMEKDLPPTKELQDILDKLPVYLEVLEAQSLEKLKEWEGK